MNEKVMATICAVAVIAAWMCAEQFDKQAKGAVDALTVSEQKLQQAQQREKDAADRLSHLVQTEGDVTQEEVDKLRADAEKRERELDEEMQAASREDKTKEAEILRLEKQVEDCQAEVAKLEEQVRDKSGGRSANSGGTNTLSAAERQEAADLGGNLQVSTLSPPEHKRNQGKLMGLLDKISEGAALDMTDSEGKTALHYACAMGSTEVVAWLVNHGANVNFVANDGSTPLDCVTRGYSANDIRTILNRHNATTGAVLRLSQSGSVPVMVEDRSDLQPMIDRMAALRCREATSALYQRRLLTLLPMIRDGAPVDLTLPETKGNTALHYSCGIGSWSITKWLVEHGANVNAVTNKGMRPLDCVGSDNAQRIRALLISRGAMRSR